MSMKKYDAYLYGMILKSNSFLLNGNYPVPDGYGEIKKIYITRRRYIQGRLRVFLLKRFGDEESMRFSAACAAVACSRFPIPLYPPKTEEIYNLMRSESQII